ncbi:MAG: integrase [Gemmatimonadetes bacterium]|nr:integrase [Gemmatimonadota bacterium]MYH19815.1 integrase [Gemmatimonadota bacterium]
MDHIMPVMLSKTYVALVAAGAPEAVASEAAEEIADFERRLSSMQSDIKLIKWILGVVLACVVVPLIRSLLE